MAWRGISLVNLTDGKIACVAQLVSSLLVQLSSSPQFWSWHHSVFFPELFRDEENGSKRLWRFAPGLACLPSTECRLSALSVPYPFSTGFYLNHKTPMWSGFSSISVLGTDLQSSIFIQMKHFKSWMMWQLFSGLSFAPFSQILAPSIPPENSSERQRNATDTRPKQGLWTANPLEKMYNPQGCTIKKH